MKPLGLVKQFHKLSRTFLFDLFGLINLEILNFKVQSSTEISREIKLEKLSVLDNVEDPDGWGPLVSDSAEISRAS
jgi:hypothetical protein